MQIKWAGMGNHRDNAAPLRGRADRRRGHIIARILGTFALAGFMFALTTGTARAGVLGEIVDELPVDIGLGQAGPAPAEPEPNGLEEVIEVVVETVTILPGDPEQAEPVADGAEEPASGAGQPVENVPEPVAGLVEQPTADGVVESVVGIVEGTGVEVVQPVVDVVQAPVAPVVEHVAPVVSGIAEPLSPVVEPALDLIGDTVGTLPGVVDQLPSPLLDVINGLVNVPGLITGIGNLVENFEEPDETAFDSAQPVVPDIPPDGKEATVTGPPVAGAAPFDPAPVGPEEPGLAATSPIPTDVTSERSPAETTAWALAPPPDPLVIAPDLVGRTGSPPVDDRDYEVAPAPHLEISSTVPASSNSGPTAGLVAVLVLLGLIAPRLSRWLRPRPVHWRPIALAEALELPG